MSRTVSATYVYMTDLVVVSCGECGVPFGMPKDFHRMRKANQDSWWCPNGHERHYIGETDAQRYKRQLAEAEDRAARLVAERDQAEASRRAWKGQATRARNRVVAGECPFCGEHVYQLARHVSRKHAEEAAADPNAEPTMPPLLGDG